MNPMVVKRFIRNSVSEVEIVVLRVHGKWENMYVVSSLKYSNTSATSRAAHELRWILSYIDLAV